MKKILLLVTLLLISFSLSAKGFKTGIYRSERISSKQTSYVTMIVGEEGMIDHILIDVLLPVDKEDYSKGITTKQILGDKYGMVKASKIKKEWYEQANILASDIVKNQGVTFKVKDDLKTDGVAGATIKVAEYVELINELIEEAKK